MLIKFSTDINRDNVYKDDSIKEINLKYIRISIKASGQVVSLLIQRYSMKKCNSSQHAVSGNKRQLTNEKYTLSPKFALPYEWTCANIQQSKKHFYP